MGVWLLEKNEEEGGFGSPKNRAARRSLSHIHGVLSGIHGIIDDGESFGCFC